MTGLHLEATAGFRADFESELLRFPTAVHDDQVDALGLIGQLLDSIRAPDRAREEEAKNVVGYGQDKRTTGMSVHSL